MWPFFSLFILATFPRYVITQYTVIHLYSYWPHSPVFLSGYEPCALTAQEPAALLVLDSVFDALSNGHVNSASNATVLEIRPGHRPTLIKIASIVRLSEKTT